MKKVCKLVFSYCDTEGTSLGCEGGGSGGGQFGALTPGLFTGGFLTLGCGARGAGFGGGFVSSRAALAAGVRVEAGTAAGGGGA